HVTITVALLAGTRSHTFTHVPSDVSDPCAVLRDSGRTSGPCVHVGAHVYTWTGGRLALALVVGALAGIVNAVILQGITGGSPGKLVVGLRVVDRQGAV